MRFYRVTIEGDEEKTRYEPTLKSAHFVAKSLYKPWWEFTYIDEIEVLTDKAGVVSILCAGKPIVQKVIASWSITPRGGLREAERGLDAA